MPPRTSFARWLLADCAEMFAAYASSPAGRLVPSISVHTIVARARSARSWATCGIAGASFIVHLGVKHERYPACTMLSRPAAKEAHTMTRETADLDLLQKLNRDYIKAVQDSDVRR